MELFDSLPAELRSFLAEFPIGLPSNMIMRLYVQSSLARSTKTIQEAIIQECKRANLPFEPLNKKPKSALS